MGEDTGVSTCLSPRLFSNSNDVVKECGLWTLLMERRASYGESNMLYASPSSSIPLFKLASLDVPIFLIRFPTPLGPRAVSLSLSVVREQSKCVFLLAHKSLFANADLSLKRTIQNGSPVRISMPSIADEDINFLESVEAAHSSHGFNDRVSEILKVTRQPTRMDSQAKYCALARGDGGVYLRMPVNPSYVEKIWVCNTLSSFIPPLLITREHRIMLRGHYWLRKLAGLSPIRPVSHWISAWAGL